MMAYLCTLGLEEVLVCNFFKWGSGLLLLYSLFCRLHADDNLIQYANKNSNNIQCMFDYDLEMFFLKIVSGFVTSIQFKQIKYYGKSKHNQIPQFFLSCQLEFVSSHRHFCFLF